MDTDDEVRDRSTFYVNVLKQQQKALSSAYILNGKLKGILGHWCACLHGCLCDEGMCPRVPTFTCH